MIDPAARLDRRSFLIGGAAAGLAALAGCGSDEGEAGVQPPGVGQTSTDAQSDATITTTTPTGPPTTVPPTPAPTTVATTAAPTTAAVPTNTVRILNWQAYIDPTEDGTVGTIDRFRAATGIDVVYSEDLNNNGEFVARLEPELAAGAPTLFDVIVPTNWMAARLARRGWLEPLPLDAIPNASNLIDAFTATDWNQNPVYGLPWQAGFTGIAYNPELVGGEITSVLDLFDGSLAGAVSLLSEPRDTLGLVMLGLGLDPTAPTETGVTEAITFVADAVERGQIRSFTGNEYLRGLESDDLAACLAWTGDIAQLQASRPDIRFIVPDEGAMLWWDTMVVPKGSPNIATAAAWMNFVYDPVEAAQVTRWVQYVSPVRGATEVLATLGGDGAGLAASPLVSPPPDLLARTHVFGTLPEDVEERLISEFLRIAGG